MHIYMMYGDTIPFVHQYARLIPLMDYRFKSFLLVIQGVSIPTMQLCYVLCATRDAHVSCTRVDIYQITVQQHICTMDTPMDCSKLRRCTKVSIPICVGFMFAHTNVITTPPMCQIE